MLRRPPRSTLERSSAASDVYKGQGPSDRAATFADRVSFGGSGRWVWFNVQDLAQMWVMNANSNQGIALVGGGNTNSELEFTSSDYIVTFVRPQMKLIYKAP